MSTSGQIFSEPELEYLAGAPAFDRAVLGRASDRWTELATKHNALIIRVSLRSGEQFAVASIRIAVTYAECDLEDGSVRLVDLRAIEQIAIEPRPDDVPKRSIGFTVSDAPTQS